ncbi:DNA-binding response regulator [Lacihabitans sp. LS3-19]|uniref:response regulator transcription factor n=1 Tax=Lacihabitans sp. LS3-19 TaxID=2487335 RepID=UPI0020CE05D3|nr:response regulator transcription factor [Lacihabitans sp. LS3-19]MCP9767067.1 DNA-binding response regulator [Lacihabitans sp. LS3-19]
MRALIIEDEKRLAEFIQMGLEENGYQCLMAYDGKSGAEIALTQSFDFILMDINMPYINGIELTEKLRKNNINCPILLLTAMGGISEKIAGLDAGADDYLVKPFEFQELLARIRAMMRRVNTEEQKFEKILKVGDLEMFISQKVVKRGEKPINLTSKEFSLLYYLIKNKNHVMSKTDIFAEIWDQNAEMDNSKVEVYINMLRNKIDKDFEPKLINTVMGMGYVLKDS